MFTLQDWQDQQAYHLFKPQWNKFTDKELEAHLAPNLGKTKPCRNFSDYTHVSYRLKFWVYTEENRQPFYFDDLLWTTSCHCHCPSNSSPQTDLSSWFYTKNQKLVAEFGEDFVIHGKGKLLVRNDGNGLEWCIVPKDYYRI